MATHDHHHHHHNSHAHAAGDGAMCQFQAWLQTVAGLGTYAWSFVSEIGLFSLFFFICSASFPPNLSEPCSSRPGDLHLSE
jgi:sorbitol-specific phosphotransferase system component IIA